MNMTFEFFNNFFLFILMWGALEHTDTNRWLGRPRLTTYIYFPIDLSALFLQNLACSELINFPLICLGFCAQQIRNFLLWFWENCFLTDHVKEKQNTFFSLIFSEFIPSFSLMRSMKNTSVIETFRHIKVKLW